MKRKKHSKELKAKVAIAVIKSQKTANEIASEFGVHSCMVNRWKKQALDSMGNYFRWRTKKERRGYRCRKRSALPADWQTAG